MTYAPSEEARRRGGEDRDSLQGPIFRRRLVGLTPAVAMLVAAVAAVPAPPAEPGTQGQPAPPRHAAPPAEPGPPPQAPTQQAQGGGPAAPPEHAAGAPGTPDEHAASQATTAPGHPGVAPDGSGTAPGNSGAAPGASHRPAGAPGNSAATGDRPAPAAESALQATTTTPRRRVQIRSNDRLPPLAEAPVADGDRPARERAARPRRGPAPIGAVLGGRRDGSGLATAEARTRAARPAGSTAPVASSGANDPAAPAAADSVPASESAAESDAPPQPFPARIVPRPVREIVEVVPGEVWAALGALALLALTLGASSWITALRARRLRRQRAALLQEVGLLQAALLPTVPAELPVSVAYRPAAGVGAGRDFYDAFALSGGRTGIVLGDMARRGRDALSRTTFVRYTLRAYLEAGLEPREVLKVGSTALADHLHPDFASVIVAVHEPVTGRLTYASAGHAPPIVVGDEPFEPVTACSAPPLGVDERTGFRQTTLTLTAGSVACLYTDGVVEARADGGLLGPARLERELAELPADADAEVLLERVADAADEVGDDMAVCILRADEDAPPSGARIEEIEVDDREVGDSLEHFLRACGVPLAEVPGVLRQAGEAARREGSATVRVRLNDFRPGVDVVPGNLVRLDERRRSVRGL